MLFTRKYRGIYRYFDRLRSIIFAILYGNQVENQYDAMLIVLVVFITHKLVIIQRKAL